MLNPGDVVECVNNTPLRKQSLEAKAALASINVGAIYRVESTFNSFSILLLRWVQCVRLRGVHLTGEANGYMDFRFRKVTGCSPDFKAEVSELRPTETRELETVE